MVIARPEDRAPLESAPSAEAGGYTDGQGRSLCPWFLFAHRVAQNAINSGGPGAADANIIEQEFTSGPFDGEKVEDLFTDVWGNDNVPANLGDGYFWQPPDEYLPGWWPRPTLIFEIHARDENGIIPASRLKILKGVLNHSVVAWNAQQQVVDQWTVHAWNVFENDTDEYPMCGVGTGACQIAMDAPGHKVHLYLQQQPDEVWYARVRYTFGAIIYDLQEECELDRTQIKFQLHTYWDNQIGYIVYDASRTFATMGPSVTWSQAQIYDETYP